MPDPILKDPKYLATTYADNMAPVSTYPQQLAAYLLGRYYGVPGTILDIGCGRGDYLQAFAGLGFVPRGVDTSFGAVEMSDGFEVLVTDMETDPAPYPPDTFDALFCKSVIEHLHKPTVLLIKGLEMLKPGGVAIFMTPSWVHNAWGPFYVDHTHVTPFTEVSLTNAMTMCGYTDVVTHHFHQLPWLWRYPLLTPLVRLLARLPIRYKPFHPNALASPQGVNKVVRFAKEVMLLAVGRKEGKPVGEPNAQ